MGGDLRHWCRYHFPSDRLRSSHCLASNPILTRTSSSPSSRRRHTLRDYLLYPRQTSTAPHQFNCERRESGPRRVLYRRRCHSRQRKRWPSLSRSDPRSIQCKPQISKNDAQPVAFLVDTRSHHRNRSGRIDLYTPSIKRSCLRYR
jgi:hypothetical protein